MSAGVAVTRFSGAELSQDPSVRDANRPPSNNPSSEAPPAVTRDTPAKHRGNHPCQALRTRTKRAPLISVLLLRAACP